MKLKYYLIVLFIVLNIFVYYVTDENVKSKIEYSKYNYMHTLQLNYETFMIAQAEKADVIYSTTTNNQKVINILSKAWNTQDEKQREILRNQLYLILKDRYKEFKKQGLLQYHFILPDNTCFLRMHKPSKFGDNLKGIRQDIVKVNDEYNFIRGFSQGRTTHAFRNVYPIFDENNEHIGAIEISYPSELLQDNLNNISEIHTHFLVNKHIFDSKMWSRDDRILNYKASLEHENYMHALSSINETGHMKNDKGRIDVLKEKIHDNISQYKLFSLVSKGENENYKIISFYPITQNVTHELSAWLVAYDNAPFIHTSIQNSNYVRTISFFIFALLLYFIYKMNQQKNKLRKILKSYDDNVIFSTTDKRGIITHVSKAFCEISGYTEEELIGKSHNIVRHENMSEEVFIDLWATIKSGKTWRGEVKNLKKDATYYWVTAEVEALYDENKNHIGYSALRHDITDKKEIEEIQKEIIFTMGTIGESRSKETGNHVKRVAEYSRVLAQKYGLSNKEVDIIMQASPMHDIGKVGIPDAILKKPAKLSEEEFTIMRTHAELGYNMLNNSERTLLKSAAIVAYEHHEKWDGSGYPRGLKGDEIHIYGRITAIADVFDALGSERVYKNAWADEKIFTLLKEESGKQFDPDLVDIFFENKEEFLEIRSKCKD